MLRDRLPVNLRTRAIEWAADRLVKSVKGPLLFLEIGAMFRMTEGVSTLLLARAAAKAPAGSRLVSIEYNEEHLAEGKALLRRLAPQLEEYIEFVPGRSLTVLPEILEREQRFHLLWLDGGAHPETCFREFELLAPRLAEQGIALVDDCHHIDPDPHFHRPLGKAQLILPWVMLQRYLQERPAAIDEKPDADWRSPAIDALAEHAAPFAEPTGPPLHANVLQDGTAAVLMLSREDLPLPNFETPLWRRAARAAVGRLRGRR